MKCEDGSGVKLHIRPGLHEFLRALAEVADVYAFTAGLPVYARPVLRYIDPENDIFRNAWYRQSCSKIRAVESDFVFYTKDLEVLGKSYDPNRTILVDNSIFSFLKQPLNGIIVPSFYDDPTDRVLPQVLDIIARLQHEKDVKPLLHEMFDISSDVNEIKSIII